MLNADAVVIDVIEDFVAVQKLAKKFGQNWLNNIWDTVIVVDPRNLHVKIWKIGSATAEILLLLLLLLMLLFLLMSLLLIPETNKVCSKYIDDVEFLVGGGGGVKSFSCKTQHLLC